MNRFVLVPVFILCSYCIFAQNLVFHGSGAALKVERVKVTNPRTGENMLFQGNKVILKSTTGIELPENSDDALKLWPNPATEKVYLSVNLRSAENVRVSLFGINGQLVVSRTLKANPGQNTFAIAPPAQGTWIVQLVTERKSFSQKFICTGNQELQPSIYSESFLPEMIHEKSSQTGTDDGFAYLLGDSLTFECFSANLSATAKIIPQGDRAYSIRFCTDDAACKPECTEYQPSVKQEVLGWGCFPSYHKEVSWGTDWGISSKPNVQKTLYADMGMNVFRVSLDNYNLNGSITLDRIRLEEVRKHIATAVKYGVKQWIGSLWTPPSHLKTNSTEAGYAFVDITGNILKIDKPWETNIYQNTLEVNGVTYTRKINRLKETSEALYADYIVSVLRYLKDNGVPLPVQISLQNEPSFVEAWYGGCVFEQAQYVRVNKLLRQKLDQAGMQQVAIAAGDHGSTVDMFKLMGRNLSVFSADKDFNTAVGHISFHSYDDNNRWDTNTARKVSDCAELTTAANNLGKQVWMTEYTSLFHNDFTPSLAGNDFAITVHETRHLIRDMLLTPTNFWLFWIGYTKDNGDGVFMYGPDNALVKKKMYYVLSKLWTSVKPNAGFRVVELKTTDKDIKTSNASALEMIGFEGPKTTVVLVVNPTTTNKPAFAFNGIFKGKEAELFTLTATSNLTSGGKVENKNGTASFFMKANSINFLVFE